MPSTPKTPTGSPLFPSFLLPSFTRPFRRRRTSPPSHSQWAHARPAVETHHSPVPSLSSSPTSTLPDSDPASPSDLDPLSFPIDWDEDQHKPPPNTAGWSPGSLRRSQPDTIRCGTCAADLAFGAQVVSKGFTGRHGRAFLVSPPSYLSTTPPGLGLDPRPYGSVGAAGLDDDTELLNIRIGRRESRQLVTGAHVVADISCAVCGTVVGWKYVEAAEAAQKYKEGKFILETQRVVAFRTWEDADGPARGFGGREGVDGAKERRIGSWRESLYSENGGGMNVAVASAVKDEVFNQEVLFDSEDEDECEDIFAGTWSPSVAVKRRKLKGLRGKKA